MPPALELNMKTLKWPAIVVLAVVLLVLCASWLLPAEHHHWLHLVESALILGEACLFGFALLKLSKILKSWRRQSEAGWLEKLEGSLAEVIGPSRLLRILSSEVAMLYYALFAWGSWVEQRPGQTVLTAHRKSTYGAVAVSLLLLSAVEVSGLHLLLSQWSHGWAWVMTALGIYGAVFILADLKAFKRRPHLLEAEALVLRTSLRWRTRVPLHQIASLEAIRIQPEKAPDLLNMGHLYASWLLTLHSPAEVDGIYGLHRRPLRITFEMDDSAPLQAALAQSQALRERSGSPD